VVKNGILRQGDLIATETAKGKVKALEDFAGKRAASLAPSAPALIGGFETAPRAGETFVAGDESVIAVAYRGADAARADSLNAKSEGEAKEGIPLILKADELGSLEALHAVVLKACGEAPCRIVDRSIGNIYEGDVKLAESSGALILGFRIKSDRAAENLAEGRRVTILTAPVIYDLEKFLLGRLKDSERREVAALAVLAVFGEPKGEEQIVGGRITAGTLENRMRFTLARGERELGEGQVVNLQLKKQNVSEAPEGNEVGLLVECPVAIKKGDLLRFVNS